MRDLLYSVLLVLAIPLLMLCIIPVQGISLRFSWQIVSIWIAGAAFAIWLRSAWWSAFFLLALLKICTGDFVITSYIALMMIGIFLAAAQGLSKIRAEIVYMAMRSGAVLLVVWMAVEALGLVRRFGPDIYIVGPFNINEAAIYLALCLPAFLQKKWIWGLPILIAGLFACHSTTGAAAACAGGIVYVLLKSGQRATLPIIGGAASLLVLFLAYCDPVAGLVANPRWETWRQIVLSFHADWDGRGLGSFADLFPVMTMGNPLLSPLGGSAWVQAHNEFLQVGFELGLQALALLVAYVIWGAVNAWMRRGNDEIAIPAAGMAAVVVSSFGFHNFHVAPIALLGVAWIGLWDNAMGSSVSQIGSTYGYCRVRE